MWKKSNKKEVFFVFLFILSILVYLTTHRNQVNNLTEQCILTYQLCKVDFYFDS